MTLAVALLALVVSVVGAIYAKQSAEAAGRSATAAEDSAKAAASSAAFDAREDHRARTPDIVVEVEQKAEPKGDSVIYLVRNGPQDLDSVVIHRPETTSHIRYEVAATGETGWGDEADLGALRLGQIARFTLALGVEKTLPDFRAGIVCCAGEDEWHLTRLLDTPRKKPPSTVW